MKLVRLTIDSEPGSDQQLTYLDICLDNITFVVETNGQAEIHFGAGDPIVIASGIWEQLRDMLVQPESIDDEE